MNQKCIGEFIAKNRKEKGITQEQLGNKLGVTNKTVSRWENGNYMPDISTIPNLCKELEIDVNEFLSAKRIGLENYRSYAEENLIISLAEINKVRKKVKLANIMGNLAIGLMISLTFSPEGMRKTIVLIVAILMISLSFIINNENLKKFFKKI
ncbi:MAG: helix-turn-helix transcriptional regulator [Peptostreptococcaceae bacterium]|nr:helix-turn-helix transcriptional regulator [Peptostreptococcaceae bacterium]